MIVMGFDVASYKTGWFVLDIENIRFKIGLIECKGSAEERIRNLHLKSNEIISKYQPSIVIIEDCYLDEHRKHKATPKRGNANTFKLLAKCQGAVISATEEITDIFYLQPSEHKQLLTGMGNASKQATVWSIQKKLGLSKVGEDEADAAALVLAYLVKRKQWHILEAINKKYSK